MGAPSCGSEMLCGHQTHEGHLLHEAFLVPRAEQSCSQSSVGRLDAQVTCPALSPRYTAHFSQPMDPS